MSHRQSFYIVLGETQKNTDGFFFFSGVCLTIGDCGCSHLVTRTVFVLIMVVQIRREKIADDCSSENVSMVFNGDKLLLC